MKIEFKLRDFDKILDENEFFYDVIEDSWIEHEEHQLRVGGYRVVIPELMASFRVGEIFSKNENVEDSDDEDPWIFEGSIYIMYEKDETDPEKFMAYTDYPIGYLQDACKENNYPFDEINNLNCYIDTDEFSYDFGDYED